MVIHGAEKAHTVTVKSTVVLIAVLLHTSQKPGQRLHEGIIVHDRIPLIPRQPAAWISVMLSQDNCLRVCLLDMLAEFLPELVIVLAAVAQVCRYIQAPAIYSIRGRHPFPGNLHNVLKQLWRILIV